MTATETISRQAYMDGKIDHQTYYTAIVDVLGRAQVERLVLAIAPIERLCEVYAIDPHFNLIPLALWDRRDAIIRDMAAHAGQDALLFMWDTYAQPMPPKTIYWSLSDSVCVLKAAARRLVESKGNDHAND